MRYERGTSTLSTRADASRASASRACSLSPTVRGHTKLHASSSMRR